MSQDPLTPGVNEFVNTKSHPLIQFNPKALVNSLNNACEPSPTEGKSIE